LKRVLPLVGILLTAGCQQVTYTYPTESRKVTAASEKIKPGPESDGVAWQKKFAAECARRFKGAYVVSPVAAWQTGLLFLNGSDGETYDKTLACLGLTGDRESNTVLTTRALLAQDPRRAAVTQGLFFVWPVAVSRVFQDDAAKLLAADVVKIGNARRGAVTAMNDWSSRRTAQPLQINFDQENVFESVCLVDVGSLSSGTKTERTTDFTEVLGAIGFPAATNQKLDLRPMSVELDNQPMRGRFRQVIRAGIPTKGEFEITDPKTGQIWLAGRS
jgi:hypothetical protein